MPVSIRATLDTNVVLAARRSPHPSSPNAEILTRWQRREFVLLYSVDTLDEYAAKLVTHGFSSSEVVAFIRLIFRHGERIRIDSFHFRHYPPDPDDVAFLLCAINGRGTHLVSYDPHLLALRSHYAGELVICEPVPFLVACRKAHP